MSFFASLFPARARSFPSIRWCNILLRSLHLVGMAGMSADYLFQAALSPLLPFWELTVLSGLAMVVLAIWSDGRWLLQWRGAAIFIKLLLLLLLPWFNELFTHGAGWGLITIIVISSLISHAPGKVRYRFWLPLLGIKAL